MHTFILNKVYPHGVWFYFPVVMVIKSTEAFLILILLGAVGIVVNRLWRHKGALTLALPMCIYLAIAMSSPLNTGIRHILPVYAFLWPLAAGAAWSLVRKSYRWACVLLALVALNAASSIATFDSHIAYANVFWGGPSNTHTLLTDSNVDWGQQLPAVRQYLQQRRTSDCWFSYIAEGETFARRYGVPCRSLPNLDAIGITAWEIVPPEIDGPVLISADELSGYLMGPGPMNPYGDFQALRPSAILEGGVLVYDGHFRVPRLAALTRRLALGPRLQADPAGALATAREVVALDTENADSWSLLGRALAATQRRDEAREAFRKAIAVAESVQPDYQRDKIPAIGGALSTLSK
jgi:tetratricopeptide (TPR) repeat protein